MQIDKDQLNKAWENAKTSLTMFEGRTLDMDGTEVTVLPDVFEHKGKRLVTLVPTDVHDDRLFEADLNTGLAFQTRG